MSAADLHMDTPALKLTPGIVIADPLTAIWLAQVNIRLRREIAWCWFQRAQQKAPASGVLPPLVDATVDNLDLVRYQDDRRRFFEQDITAAYLTQEIEKLDVQLNTAQQTQTESTWYKLVNGLQLDEAAQFVLALAVAYRVDAAMGPLCGTCMNDLSRPYPALALAQRLWEEPLAVVDCGDPSHVLYRSGLLQDPQRNAGSHPWLALLDCHPMIVAHLIDPQASWPQPVSVLTDDDMPLQGHALDTISLARIRARSQRQTQIIPLLGAKGAGFRQHARQLGEQLQRPVLATDAALLKDRDAMSALSLLAWLKHCDLLLPEYLEWTEQQQAMFRDLLLHLSLPLNWYLPVSDRRLLSRFPVNLMVPELEIAALGFEQRKACFKYYLDGVDRISDYALDLCAQRFRFEQQMIKNASEALHHADKVDEETLLKACAHEATLEFNDLAQHVQPRFSIDELVLPDKQKQQYLDIVHGMRNLTLVHHRWGTARAWNEGGLSVLFCGPPGTGKTMAAEALAQQLNLPMYRIDLSQVVNKYIGETEKNLRRIFNAAEMTDCILFFDEADAVFGKRTDVKDAHDRFANIEISYLLERMERFKGLAILATNRRRDLDDAFMRRLRYVVEFNVPEQPERKQIWQQVFPSSVDTSELDINYLARQFKLSGGHIRSIAFNTCLRSADVRHPDAPRRVSMENTLLAVRQELAKMERSISHELFGEYADLLRAEDE